MKSTRRPVKADEPGAEDEELMRLVDQQVEDFERLQVTSWRHNSQSVQWMEELAHQHEEEEEEDDDDDDDTQDHSMSSLWEDLEPFELQASSPPSRAQPSDDAAAAAAAAAEEEDFEMDEEMSRQCANPCASPNSSWQPRAHQESLACQASQWQNQQLKALLQQHVAICHQMRHEIVQQVQKNSMLQQFCDTLKAFTDLKRARTRQVVDLTAMSIETPREKRFRRLIHRLDFAFLQMQLVLGGRPMAFIPIRLGTGSPPYHHDLSIRCVKSLTGNDFVELVGSTVTCFDANTLVELLWKAFASKRPGPCTQYVMHHEAQKQTLDEDTVHWEGSFVGSMLGVLDANLEASTLICRRQNTFVIDGIGRIRLRAQELALPNHSFPDELEFNRTVWYRVDPLPDGRSSIYHVHRAQPLVGANSPAVDQEQIQLQLQLVTEMLQRSHYQMSVHCQKLALQLFGQKTRVVVGSDGWPLRSIEF